MGGDILYGFRCLGERDKLTFEPKVRVNAINGNADLAAEYPRLVESVGQAPSQYRGWNEDEIW